MTSNCLWLDKDKRIDMNCWIWIDRQINILVGCQHIFGKTDPNAVFPFWLWKKMGSSLIYVSWKTTTTSFSMILRINNYWLLLTFLIVIHNTYVNILLSLTLIYIYINCYIIIIDNLNCTPRYWLSDIFGRFRQGPWKSNGWNWSIAKPSLSQLPGLLQ